MPTTTSSIFGLEYPVSSSLCSCQKRNINPTECLPAFTNRPVRPALAMLPCESSKANTVSYWYLLPFRCTSTLELNSVRSCGGSHSHLTHLCLILYDEIPRFRLPILRPQVRPDNITADERSLPASQDHRAFLCIFNILRKGAAGVITR